MRPGPLPILLALAPCVAAPVPARHPRAEALVAAVDAARMKAQVARLAAFGTRHTLSDTESPTRGIGAARRWLASEFQVLVGLPGSRLEPFEDRFTAEAGGRLPRPVELVNLGVRLPGTDPARARETLVVVAHYDSRADGALDAEGEAPGANDDASGVALVLEMARQLAAEQPAVGIHFVAVAGEEQGLLGSAHLARRLKAEGVQVLACLAADMVGNSEGENGVRDNTTVRLFAEGVPAAETPEQRRLREAVGSENDSGSREWGRYLQRHLRAYVAHLDPWLMLRRDRLGRGGDHTPFAREGFPAARIVETHEHYGRQHKVPRQVDGVPVGDTPEFVDGAYLARITQGCLAAYWHLAHAPAAPRRVLLGRAGAGTRLDWTLPPDARIQGVVVYRRRADGVAWQRAERHPRVERLAWPTLSPDNEVFAVATVDAEGCESLPAAVEALAP